jgi:hypothetical protein
MALEISRLDRPLPAALTRMGLVIAETGGIGLDNVTAVKEQQPGFFGRHLRNERLGFAQRLP